MYKLEYFYTGLEYSSCSGLSYIPLSHNRRSAMTKERNSSREAKKQPALSLKEKRAAKKAKKDNKPAFLPHEKK